LTPENHKIKKFFVNFPGRESKKFPNIDHPNVYLTWTVFKIFKQIFF